MNVRTERVTVRFTEEERAELAHRAAAHGVGEATFLRSSALAGSAAEEGTPDAWWDKQSSSRKAQIMQWLTARAVNRPCQDEVLLDMTP